MHKRLIGGGCFMGVLLACGAASAQETSYGPPAATTPPVSVASTDPSLTAAEPAPVPETPVQREKPCGLVWKGCRQPHLTLALDGGVSSFNESGPFGFDTGTGSVSSTGGSWGARVGVELTKWFAVDGHYIGMNNHASGAAAPNGSVSLLTNAATAEVRFTLPIPYVQPYLFAGAGVYSTSVTGSETAQAASPLTGSTELGIPMGVGVQVPITKTISVGGELTYHRLFGEVFAADDAIGGGDLTTFNAVVRAKL